MTDRSNNTLSGGVVEVMMVKHVNRLLGYKCPPLVACFLFWCSWFVPDSYPCSGRVTVKPVCQKYILIQMNGDTIGTSVEFLEKTTSFVVALS
jgi:hypothetical protein